MSNRLTETRRAEFVESHNIVSSLNRLAQAPYDNSRWKRALYHAILLADISISYECRKKIREALELP